MSQVNFHHRAPRRYLLNDIPALPLLAYEDYETLTLGGVDFADGWADAGIVYTYAGEIAYEDYETSTLTNNLPRDHGWITDGVLFFSVAVTGSAGFVDLGGTVTLTATPSTSAGSSLTYQWFQNGVSMTNGGAYSGVTTSAMTITGTISGDYTTYTCAVTCLGFTYSNSAYTLIDRATDWSNRVVTNGGAAPAGATVTALRTFWNGCLSDGIVASNINAMNCFVPDSLTAAITPFIRGAGSDPWTNHSFVGGDLTVNGLVGNGSSKYLDTGVVGSTSMPSFTSGVAWYCFTEDNTAVDFGIVGSGTAHLLARQGFYRNGDSTVNNIAPTPPGNGFYVTNRTSTTDHRAYFANSGHAFAQLGSTDSATDALAFPAATTMYVFAYNFGGPNAVSLSRMSFLTLVKGFNSTNFSNLFTRTQALRTSLGGGFV
jgi:hypothetical protein